MTPIDTQSPTALHAVVIGGGTGAPVSIRALLALGVQTSAIVAMADDGGSTGMLREHTGIAAPGDIRKCIVAMAENPSGAWTKAFRQRFNYVNDHTLGNLMLTALTEATGSFPEAIRLCEDLLHARGHVLPSTLESVKLRGVTLDGRQISGQANLCVSDTALAQVALTPDNPCAFQPALDAIQDADLIVLGPGSLFTSIIPNLLVPGMLEAIRLSRAATVFLCSLADQQGETWGLNAAELVEALLAHGMGNLLDVVVVHQEGGEKQPGNVTTSFAAITADDPSIAPTDTLGAAACGAQVPGALRRVAINPALVERIESYGPSVIIRDLVDPDRTTWHDVHTLSEVLKGVFDLCPSLRKSKTNSLD
ncbi:MAG: YvcK family protein [Coriobacteriales bacterium]|nr:YvcK family protein [Coriobacteriales bacterium]